MNKWMIIFAHVAVTLRKMYYGVSKPFSNNLGLKLQENVFITPPI
jgi:hypothetical protein